MTLNYPKLWQTEAYIDGQWLSADTGNRFDVHNPYDQSLLAQVADCGTDETRRAIDAAHRAFGSWKQLTAHERSKRLRRWFELQVQHADDLARILTLEQGKPLAEAKGEVLYGASFVEWFAEEARRVYGDTIPGHEANRRILVIKQPVGVVAAITPWNFPNSMITRKVAPALAAGCTCVVKPAKLTPLSANALAVLAEEAGIPPGVLNVVHSSRASAIGNELTANPLVRKLSFTGSTEVGKELMRQCAEGVKKLSLELGGNAPFIVFDDADLDKAVQGAIASKFRNAGQTCVCTNRILAQAGIYQAFTLKLKEELAKLKLGNGLDHQVSIGPLIDDKARQFVQDMVDDAVAKGASVLCGGQIEPTAPTVFRPTVLCDVRVDMRVFSEEIFGPIAPVFRFETEEEAIRLANDTPYGLAAYFYGNNNAQIWRVAEALEYGMVGINTGLISTTVAPFGGVKESGFGREGSKYGIDDYLNIKYLSIEI